MALAPLNTDPAGRFVEKDHGYVFEYCVADAPAPPAWEDYQHWVWVGPKGDQRRWARVLKTRVHIVTDENADGSPVTECWYFRSHVPYNR